jgi:hypothetical protein
MQKVQVNRIWEIGIGAAIERSLMQLGLAKKITIKNINLLSRRCKVSNMGSKCEGD